MAMGGTAVVHCSPGGDDRAAHFAFPAGGSLPPSINAALAASFGNISGTATNTANTAAAAAAATATTWPPTIWQYPAAAAAAAAGNVAPIFTRNEMKSHFSPGRLQHSASPFRPTGQTSCDDLHFLDDVVYPDLQIYMKPPIAYTVYNFINEQFFLNTRRTGIVYNI